MAFSRRDILAAGLVLGGAALWPMRAHAADTITIGFTGPLSGGAAFYGKNVLDGMKFAANEINEQGLEINGKKTTLEIVAFDDQYNPSQAAINAQRLVQEYKAPVVVVPHSGGIFALQTRNEQQNLLIVAYSSLPELTARGNRLTLQMPPNITDYFPAFTGYEMERFGKNLAIAVTDSDYGKVWADLFKSAWEEAGGTVVSNDTLSYNKSADFYSGVSRAISKKPDVMLIGGPSEPTGLVVKQARELGYKGGFAVIDQAKFDEVAQVSGGMESLEGSVGVLPMMLDRAPVVQAFVKRFRQTHPDRIVGTEIGLPYIAVHAVADAMKLAGSGTDATAIRAKLDKAFADLPEQFNLMGYYDVTEQGHARMNTRVAVVEDGKVREIQVSEFEGK